MGNEAVKREVEYMEAQLRNAKLDAEQIRKSKAEVADLKSRVIKIVELLERRSIGADQYEVKVLCDFIYSKTKKLLARAQKCAK